MAEEASDDIGYHDAPTARGPSDASGLAMRLPRCKVNEAAGVSVMDATGTVVNQRQPAASGASGE
jgi:hypothetical protein